MAKYIKSDGRPKAKQYLYAERIKASEKLRIDINFEEDLFKMLDKSLLLIYIMTGDESFYKQNRDKLIKKISEWNYK
ncbi:MAG: hypothetical protein ACRC7N_00685 [Clostridium sp.]